jgi:hypothetical protein
LAWIIFHEPIQVSSTTFNKFRRRQQPLGDEHSAYIAAQLIAITEFALRRGNAVAPNHWRKVYIPAFHVREIITPMELT